MANTQPTKTKNESELKADTSEDSTKLKLVADTESKESTSSSPTTTADTQTVSTKTWTSAELAELKLKAGLVAGALADFQAAKGVVVTKEIEHEKGVFSLKIYLVAEGVSIKKKNTPDGLDFDVLPLG